MSANDYNPSLEMFCILLNSQPGSQSTRSTWMIEETRKKCPAQRLARKKKNQRRVVSDRAETIRKNDRWAKGASCVFFFGSLLSPVSRPVPTLFQFLQLLPRSRGTFSRWVDKYFDPSIGYQTYNLTASAGLGKAAGVLKTVFFSSRPDAVIECAQKHTEVV